MDALFDVEQTSPVESPALSADRKRTQRQKRDVDDGYHPLLTVLYGRYPETRIHERGADGEPYTCGSCAFRELLSYRNRKFAKCVMSDGARITHGAATDVRAWWPACRDWEPGDNSLSLDAARWIPEVAE